MVVQHAPTILGSPSAECGVMFVLLALAREIELYVYLLCGRPLSETRRAYFRLQIHWVPIKCAILLCVRIR